MPPDATATFFVSYTSADRAWAEWIAWTLEEQGFSCRIQAWDFQAGSSFMQDMHRALQESEQTIGVLSPDYLASKYPWIELASAYKESRFIPVRVVDFEPGGIFGGITYVDLVGIDEGSAKKALLSRVTRERRKPPVPPPLPRNQRRHDHGPAYPGEAKGRFWSWGAVTALAAAFALGGVLLLVTFPPWPPPPLPPPTEAEVARALTGPDEPTFPVACVSRDGPARAKILEALQRRAEPETAQWLAVPAESLERRFVDARAALKSEQQRLNGTTPPIPRSLEATRRKLDAIIADCGACAVAHKMLGYALLRQGRDYEAEQHFRLASTLAPDYDAARIDLAIALLQQKRYEAAVTTLNELLTRSPGHPKGLRLRGGTWLRIGRADDASRDLHRYTMLAPHDGEGWWLLSQALDQARPPRSSDAKYAACRALAAGLKQAEDRCKR